MAQTNAVPFINQPLKPESVQPGGPAFNLSVSGTGFVSGSVVDWNGAALTTSFVDSSHLTAAVPASDIAVAGTVSVTVANPAPGGGLSNVVYFDVASPASNLVFSDLYSGSGGTGFSIITADFNQDGKLDLAYISGGPPTLLVELGNGDGTLQAPLSFPADSYALNLFTADFNGDGIPDIASANGYDNTVSIYLGNGDGTFQAAQTFATGLYPQSIVAGDFNGDGKLDLAVDCNGDGGSNGSISILLGNGDGTFQAHIDYSPPGTGLISVNSMTMGDFDGDGKLDLALVDAQVNEIFVLLGQGNGTFKLSGGASTLAYGYLMIAADVNADGRLDLLVDVETTPGNLAVLLGNGDGTFQTPVEYSMGANSATSLVTGDFNADGKIDIAAATSSPSGAPYVAVLLGNGDGTFESPLTFPTNPPGCWAGDICFPIAVAAGDFNGDGRTDIAAIVANNPNPILVMLQGIQPALTATPSSLSFGQQNVGTTSAPQSLIFTNTGNAVFDVSGIGVTGANAADFSQNNNCGATLASGATCQVNVTFTPTLAASRTAAITVTGISVNPFNVSIAGLGYGALVSVSPSSTAFPSQYVGTSGLPQTVIVTNTGTAPLTISNVATSVADFGVLSNCTNSVPPNTNCTIGVYFDPTTSGLRTGTLIITDNASGSPHTVALSGSGEDFSLTTASSTQTVSPGQTASYSLSLSPAGGFNQTVQISCTGAPAGTTCSASPSLFTLNGSTPQTVTITVTPISAAASLTRPQFGPPLGGAYYAVWCLGIFGLVMLVGLDTRYGERRRRWGQGIALVCLFWIAVTISGCGGGSSSGGSQAGIQAGTYNLTATANFASGSVTLTHTTKLTLIVQ